MADADADPTMAMLGDETARDGVTRPNGQATNSSGLPPPPQTPSTTTIGGPDGAEEEEKEQEEEEEEKEDEEGEEDVTNILSWSYLGWNKSL